MPVSPRTQPPANSNRARSNWPFDRKPPLELILQFIAALGGIATVVYVTVEFL